MDRFRELKEQDDPNLDQIEYLLYQSTQGFHFMTGCFGKRSNLDVKWQRDFIKQKPGKLNNYID